MKQTPEQIDYYIETGIEIPFTMIIDSASMPRTVVYNKQFETIEQITLFNNDNNNK